MPFHAGRFPTRDYPAFEVAIRYVRGHAITEDHPVRMINGRERQIQRNVAPNEDVLGSMGIDRETWDDSGITIYMCATLGVAGPYESAVLPDEWLPEERRGRYRDGWRIGTLTSQGNADTEPITLNNGTVLGEYNVSTRQIACFLNLSNIPYWMDRDSQRLMYAELFDAALEQVATGNVDDEARVERNIQAFIVASRERNRAELNTIEARIRDQEAILTNANQQINTARTQLMRDQELIDAVLGRREDTADDQFRAEWEALARHENVEALRFVGTTLHIKTGDIIMHVPDTPYSSDGERDVTVGQYDITINFDSNSLFARNLTNQREGLDHPHVRNGTFCLGELDQTMARLVRERQIAAAANLAIDTLKHVNPEDSWGRAERYWD